MGFTFRGIHTSEFKGLVIKTINNPLSPAKRIQRVNVMGCDGEYVFESGYNNKILEFRCSLANGTIIERRQRAREIASWLSSTGDLVLDYENDKAYKVVKTISDISLAIEQAWDEFNITFETEPFQYGGLKTLSFDNPSTMVVNNQGTYEAETIITITGTGNVTVSSSDYLFTLTGMTGKLNVDSKKMLVYSDAKVSGISKHSGNFIKLKPGNNTITVTGSVSNMTVKFQDTYI
ncbi:MAG: phage tail family protein [Prolixibacteraceae bacterium]|nr:phage tail family protein [Prolixibacteraceae bacterium]